MANGVPVIDTAPQKEIIRGGADREVRTPWALFVRIAFACDIALLAFYIAWWLVLWWSTSFAVVAALIAGGWQLFLVGLAVPWIVGPLVLVGMNYVPAILDINWPPPREALPAGVGVVTAWNAHRRWREYQDYIDVIDQETLYEGLRHRT